MRPASFGSRIEAKGASGAALGLRRTTRRVTQLARYTAHHKLRAAIATVTLLGSTATTIAGPVIAKQAIDRGITPGVYS